jgi:hypothetical protein
MAFPTHSPSKAIIVSVGSAGEAGATNSIRPVMTGTADANTTVILYDGVRYLGSAAVSPSGEWSFTPPIDVKTGNRQFRAISRDSQGNQGTSSEPMHVTVNAAPTPPVPFVVNGLADDTGRAIPFGGTTADQRPSISGTARPGDTVTLYDGSTTSGAKVIGSVTVGQDGKWSITPTLLLPSGTHDLYVTQTGTTGAVSANSSHFVITVDTTPLTVPVVHGLTDAAGQVISPGGSTGDSHPSISGTGGSGHTIKVYDGWTVIGSTTVSPAGTWSLTPATDLSNGSHYVYAIEQNLAGVPSAASNRIPFNVYPSSDAPAILVLGEYDVNHINVGNVALGGTTAHTRLQLEGYSVPGALIKVYDGMTLLGSAVAKFNGTWAFYSENWPNGQHHLSATQTNTSGQESARSENVTYTVEYNGPEAPVMLNLSVRDANYQQMDDHLQSGSVATYPYINVTGSGEPNGIVTVYDGSTVLGTTFVGAGGTWFFYAPVLADGRHDLTATLASATGQVSSHSDAYVVNVDTSGYAAPIILSMRDSTGTIPAGHSTHETHVVVNGTGKIGDLITLYGTGDIIGTAIVDSTRHWSIETSTPLTNGWNYVLAMSALAAGTPDARSDYYSFIVDTESLAAPDITRITGDDATGHYMDDINPGQTILGTGQLVDPVAPAVFLGAQAAETLAGLVPPDSITPIAPRAPMIGGKTRAVVPIDENAQKDTQPDTTQTAPLASVGEPAAATPTASGHTMDLAGDPAAYFKEGSAHVQGTALGVDTLHLAGDHQVLDLTSLSGKTVAAKISGIEVIDLGGQHNTLKLSLVDVLNLGQQDLFRNDGKQQMMVSGKTGDSVDLSNIPVAGIAGGEWEQHGSALVGGASYNVYEHSGAHIELLVQQGVLTALHN